MHKYTYLKYFQINISGLQCLANTSRNININFCECPADCTSIIYSQEISTEQLSPLYSQTFNRLSNNDNYLYKLVERLNVLNILMFLFPENNSYVYEAKLLEDRYDDIIESSSVVHFYFKESGIIKYTQEEVFGTTELIGKSEFFLHDVQFFMISQSFPVSSVIQL